MSTKEAYTIRRRQIMVDPVSSYAFCLAYNEAVASLNIKHPLAHKLASDIAQRTGETMTEVVIVSLMHRLSEIESRPAHGSAKERLLALIEDAAKVPIADPRTPDEIIGYDENGLLN